MRSTSSRSPREVQERVARLRTVLQALEREPQIEGVVPGVRPLGIGCEQRTVGVRRVLPALLHESPLAPRRQLGLGRDVGRRDDARLKVDVHGRLRWRDGRGGGRAPPEDAG